MDPEEELNSSGLWPQKRTPRLLGILHLEPTTWRKEPEAQGTHQKGALVTWGLYCTVVPSHSVPGWLCIAASKRRVNSHLHWLVSDNYMAMKMEVLWTINSSCPPNPFWCRNAYLAAFYWMPCFHVHRTPSLPPETGIPLHPPTVCFSDFTIETTLSRQSLATPWPRTYGQRNLVWRQGARLDHSNFRPGIYNCLH